MGAYDEEENQPVKRMIFLPDTNDDIGDLPPRASDKAPRPRPVKVEREAQEWIPNAKVRTGGAIIFGKIAVATFGVAVLLGLAFAVFKVFESYV